MFPHHFLCGADDGVRLRKGGFFEMARIWNRHLRRTDPFNRGIQVVEGFFGDPRRDLTSEASGSPSFVDNEGPSCKLTEVVQQRSGSCFGSKPIPVAG
jgi:hypothetical protein